MARYKLAAVTLALAASQAAADAPAAPFREGDRFPSIVLPSLDGGEPLSIADFRGERLAVHVFAPWSVACRVHVPGWHAATAELQSEGKLRMIGIVEEQHADRARLFMQWNRMDWPVLVDSYGLLDVSAVPITLLIDEHGVIRHVVAPQDRPSEQVETFLAASYEAPDSVMNDERDADRPQLRTLARAARRGGVEELRAYAAALATAGGPHRLERALEMFERAAALAPEDGRTWFGLGVAYRARYDSERRQIADFQRAIDAWSRAFEIDPYNYIWRRRLEQYGPRVAKPYAFYDWIVRARADLLALGEEPTPLIAEPTHSELALPTMRFEPSAGAIEPDPEGKITRDAGRLVAIHPAVVEIGHRAGGSACVHLELRPVEARRAHWDNAGGALVVWLFGPKGWELETERIEVAPPAVPASDEPRRIEVELRRTAEVTASPQLVGYALYPVCEGRKRVCVYRRQDVSLRLPEVPPAPE